jgi:hypothetical protein
MGTAVSVHLTRTTKKFGPELKNSTALKSFPRSQCYCFLKLILLPKGTKNQKIHTIKLCFLQISTLFALKIMFKKSSAPFQSFWENMKKIRPPIFPAARIFIRPILSSAPKFRPLGNTLLVTDHEFRRKGSLQSHFYFNAYASSQGKHVQYLALIGSYFYDYFFSFTQLSPKFIVVNTVWHKALTWCIFQAERQLVEYILQLST